MSLMDDRTAPAGSALPVLLTPASPGQPLAEARECFGAAIEAHLHGAGGVLLRGFGVPTVGDFRAFAASFGHPLLDYAFASTPRSDLGAGVYTSTEYPAHQHIALHNEQAYTREWPMRIWFHCVTPSPVGGETPIGDSRAVFRRLPASVRQRLAAGLRYVRHYGELDVPWQTVFGTADRRAVEAYCRRAHIDWQWLDDDGLRTSQWCPATEVHPRTGETVWFNQGHLFHASNLPAEVRESLEDLLGPDQLPRNVYDAEGRPIPDAVFDEIRGVLADETVCFPWQAGDVLMLDNMLVAHGRRPFEGPRQVVVAMAEAHGNLPAAPSTARAETVA